MYNFTYLLIVIYNKIIIHLNQSFIFSNHKKICLFTILVLKYKIKINTYIVITRRIH